MDQPQDIPQNTENIITKSESRLPKNKLKLIFGFLAIVFLPLIVIASVLGPKVVDTTKGTNAHSLADAPDPAVVGQWSNVFELPVKATHTNLLANGKILTWPSFTEGDNPYIFDPIANTSVAAPHSGLNIFCSGQVTMSDGKVFVAGGHIITPEGIPSATIYDPLVNTWKRIPDMNAGRWYPTTHVLPNGDILVISGDTETGIKNKIPQVWDIRKNKWRDLTGAQLSVSLYPFMFTAPNGKIFMAGSSKSSRYLDTSGTGKWGKSINSIYGTRSAGSAAEYAKGKIIIIGGASDSTTAMPTNTAEIIDLNQTSPKWTYTSPMSTPRHHANSTILPTGQILITGGTSGPNDDETHPVFLAEMWNPSTGKWTQLSSNSTYRGYHSTALLLPDGRVFVGGGEKSGNSAEFFSPPYLFQGPRPVISAAPKNVNFGQKFTIKTPNASDIKAIKWIRLGSVTHSFNQSQVISHLSFTKTGATTLTLTAPSNGIIDPPGYYMLFILNNNNIPSVAKIINFGNIKVDLSKIISPTNPVPTPGTTNSNEKVNHSKMSM